MTTIQVCYDSSWGWKMTDLFEDVKKKLGLHSEIKLLSYVTSYSTC
jgi:hypothetical protein